MAGDGFAGGGAVLGGQNLFDVGDGIAAASDVQKGAYDGTDHIAEEAVGGNRKYQVIRPFDFAQGDR